MKPDSGQALTREQLQRMYWEFEMNQYEIAEELNVSQQRVSEAMIKFGIERRGVGPGRSFSKKPASYYTNKESGYEEWNVYLGDGNGTSVRVHQLVAIADGSDPKKVFKNSNWHIHHKNGVPWDNRFENIELITAKKHREIHVKRGDYGVAVEEYSRDELLSWIDAFVEEFGVVPASTDAKDWPGPSPLVYRDRFGGWPEAIRTAGYTPRSSQND